MARKDVDDLKPGEVLVVESGNMKLPAKVRKNIGFIKGEEFFINSKLLGCSAMLCAMVDGCEMLCIEDGKYIGIPGVWVRQYSEEIKQSEPNGYKYLNKFLDQISEQYGITI